jgi:hypothetical protein
MARRWVMLTDMYGGARIMSLDEHEDQQEILVAQVANNKTAVGLRRMILEETGHIGTSFRETGEFAPMTPELHLALSLAYRPRNGWNYDWPHLGVEQDLTAEATLRTKLEAMMAAHPFEFKLTGLQRRFLVYFSDGNIATQKFFEGVAPYPDKYPYTTKGQLRKPYCGSVGTWGSAQRDAGVPTPSISGKPVLYTGPAWAVCFTLDDQRPLHGNCVMYVNDNGDFLCSDWCQRHDFSSYGDGGINLQLGMYTFDNWIIGPCIENAMSVRAFQPRSVKVERVRVREVEKNQRAMLQQAKDSVRAQYASIQSVTKTANAVDALTERVLAIMQQKPALSRAEQAAVLLAECKAGIVSGHWPHVRGARAWIGAKTFHLGVAHLPQKMTDSDIEYLYTFGDHPCGVTVPAQHICFKHGGKHQHWYTSELSYHKPQLAEAETLGAIHEVFAKLDQKKAEQAAAAAADHAMSPITPEVMAMAEAAFQELKHGTPSVPNVPSRKEKITLHTFMYEGTYWRAQIRAGWIELYGPFTAPISDAELETESLKFLGCFIRKLNGHVYHINPHTHETSLLPHSLSKRAAIFYFDTFKPAVPPLPSTPPSQDAPWLGAPEHDDAASIDSGPFWDADDPADNEWTTEQV